METPLEIHYLGCIPFGQGLQLQRDLHRQIVQGLQKAVVLVLEHTSVVTLGLHANEQGGVLSAPEHLKALGIDLEKIDRGGEATAHEPGQLIVYPILNMRALRLSPRKYVRCLEDTVIELLEAYNLAAYRDEKYPGVWVADTKVCAIGIRISRGVSYHGIALNVNNSLATFSHIIPCGIKDRGLNTMSMLLKTRILVEEVAKHFVHIFIRKLGLSEQDLIIKNQGDYAGSRFDLQWS